MEIRDVLISDAEDLLKIYGYYVENTAISFEEEVPTIEEFRGRIVEIIKRYPYLVVVHNGEVKGYAYGNILKPRSAYSKSVEVSIYLDPSARKLGLGRALYEALEERLREIGIQNLYACIGKAVVEDEYLDNNSIEFHAHLGFNQVGEFHRCGNKFNRWYNIVWMEKLIGE